MMRTISLILGPHPRRTPLRIASCAFTPLTERRKHSVFPRVNGAIPFRFYGEVPFTLLSAFVFLHSSFAGQPNFLLVMADDMGFSDLGCYGSEIEKRPTSTNSPRAACASPSSTTRRSATAAASASSAAVEPPALRREPPTRRHSPRSARARWLLHRHDRQMAPPQTAHRLRLSALLRPPLRCHELLHRRQNLPPQRPALHRP